MDNTKAISRIENEIEKINKKESKVFFFVIDTKGNPSGGLSYIYDLAMMLREDGYKVEMLYQEQDEFVGVESWMGEKYASLPHSDIAAGDTAVSASDILFIPELFSNIMAQTKKLPCKRIVILQNYDFVLEQMPISAQWGDLGVLEAVVNTKQNEEKIKDIFPYVKTSIINPFINNVFCKTPEPKKMIINIISKDQRDINRIIKPFYWKYPMYKWVSFRDLRGFPREKYAQMLREAAITIWSDSDTNFGYGALEAMKSGSLVIAKLPETSQDWMLNEEKNGLADNCIWFDKFEDVHHLIASTVRAFITDSIPSEIDNEAQKTIAPYTYENTKESFVKYVSGVFENRKKEMESLKIYIKSNNTEEEKTKDNE